MERCYARWDNQQCQSCGVLLRPNEVPKCGFSGFMSRRAAKRMGYLNARLWDARQELSFAVFYFWPYGVKHGLLTPEMKATIAAKRRNVIDLLYEKRYVSSMSAPNLQRTSNQELGRWHMKEWEKDIRALPADNRFLTPYHNPDAP